MDADESRAVLESAEGGVETVKQCVEGDERSRAARLCLEAWAFRDPRRRDVVWGVRVNERSVTAVAAEVGVSRAVAYRWLAEYDQMARQSLAIVGLADG